MSDYIKRLEAALRAYERVVSTREVTGSTEADRRFSEGEIYLSAREAMFDELAELEPQDLRSLLADVERMRGALRVLVNAVHTVNDHQGRIVVDRHATEQARQALSAPTPGGTHD